MLFILSGSDCEEKPGARGAAVGLPGFDISPPFLKC